MAADTEQPRERWGMFLRGECPWVESGEKERKVWRRRHLRRGVKEFDFPADALWGASYTGSTPHSSWSTLTRPSTCGALSHSSQQLFQAFLTFFRFPPVPPSSSSPPPTLSLKFYLEIIESEFLRPFAILATNWPASEPTLSPFPPPASCMWALPNSFGTWNDQLSPMSCEHWSVLFLPDYPGFVF